MKYAAAYLLVRNACATTVRRIPSHGVRRALGMCTDVPTVGGILARGERRLPGAQTHPDDADALPAFASHLDVVRTRATRASFARTPAFVFPRIRVFR
jgi:hypothetical protein